MRRVFCDPGKNEKGTQINIISRIVWVPADESWGLLEEECGGVCVAVEPVFQLCKHFGFYLDQDTMGRGHKVGRVLRFFSSRPFGSWRRVTLDAGEEVGESQF
jgi:hypothetical protein